MQWNKLASNRATEKSKQARVDIKLAENVIQRAVFCVPTCLFDEKSGRKRIGLVLFRLSPKELDLIFNARLPNYDH